MRILTTLLLLLCYLQADGQHLVTGQVSVKWGRKQDGISVKEIGTSNKTTTDSIGRFELTTKRDSTLIEFRMPGLIPQTIAVNQDTSLVILMEIHFYNTRWLSFGIHHEAINGTTGLQFSNGADEESLIHFEDFQDQFILKTFAQSDFNNSYAYGVETGLTRLPFTGRTTLNYTRLNLKPSNINLHDLYLVSKIKYFINIGLTIRAGYQELNQEGNFSFGFGLERQFYPAHLAINTRYLFDYFHHQAVLQVRFSKKNLFSFRAVYERIDNQSLLNMGINYAFKRTRRYQND